MKCLHIIKSTVAKSAGLKFYVSHKLCPKGHFSIRYIGSGCLDCKNEFIENNRDIIRAWDLKSKRKNILKVQEQRKSFRENNREKLRVNQAQYRKNNPEKVKESLSKWYQANPFAAKALRHKRRALEKMAEGKFSKEYLIILFEKQKGKCALCGKILFTSGKDKFHADHIQPISKGGSNWINNIQITCPFCNLSKRDKDPILFAQENGKLL